MGNKSFSLAVWPLHRFISILIFIYLEKCSFFRKNTGTRKIISLDFTTVMSFDLLVSVTTINMVSTVRVNGSLLD